MKLSSRELSLLWLTFVTLLSAFGYLYLESKIKSIIEFQKTQKALKEEIKLYQKILNSKPDLVKKLQNVRAKLPSYPSEEDVTADYMKTLEQLVKEHGVMLIQRKPQKEKRQNNLYELAIDCTWEAELDSLIKFLNAILNNPLIMEIKDISISLVGAGKTKLKGNFTLLCLYTKENETQKQETNTLEQVTNNKQE